MPGHPYVGKLPDGRYFTVELPEGSTERDDATNEMILLPAAIHLLDQLRTLLSPLPSNASASRLRLLRDTLDLSVDELAAELQLDSSVIASWEANRAKPTAEERMKLELIRRRAARRGILLPAESIA